MKDFSPGLGYERGHGLFDFTNDKGHLDTKQGDKVSHPTLCKDERGK